MEKFGEVLVRFWIGGGIGGISYFTIYYACQSLITSTKQAFTSNAVRFGEVLERDFVEQRLQNCNVLSLF